MFAVLVVLAAGCAARPGPVHPGADISFERGTAHTSPPADRAVRQLQADLAAIFDAPLIRHAHWGVLVRSLDSGDLLFGLSANKLMMPASNMKIVTVAAAGHVLGWDARFTTTLETTAAIRHGVLQGDLVVRGGGDPTLNARGDRGHAVFGEWARALQVQGIEAIDGRIVGDDRLFDSEGLGTGWAWDDLHNGYAAPVGALQFNHSTADLIISPGAAAGEPAIVELTPGAGLVVLNRTVTTTAGIPETIEYRRHLDRPVLDVSGTIPLPSEATEGEIVANAPLFRQVAVTNPTRFFVHALKDALVANGIAVRGEAVDIDDVAEPPPDGAYEEAAWRVLARTESPPLREIAAVLMKVSQNLYAESVLKSLGVATAGQGTTAAGRSAVQSVLRGWGIEEAALIMADGSGLSRYNYMSPALIVRILERMYSDARHRDPFVASLPIAGRDGTIETRMRRSLADGNVTAKTGSLSNVRALSGYVRARNGEMLVFSMIANSFAIPGPTVTWIADLAVEVLANFSRER